MTDARYRVLLVASHPVQYASPIFRRMVQHPKLDILVTYCSLQGAKAGRDPGFGMELAWDIPLLEGYPWLELRNYAPRPRLEGFFGLVNPGIWKLVRSEQLDAIIFFTGYLCSTFWIGFAAAKLSRKPLLFATDAHSLSARDKQNWKARIKRLVLPWIYSLPDVVIVPSNGGVALMRSLGIPAERIALTPYTVDNDWWIRQAQKVNRAAVRSRWGIPLDAAVVLFCAKLQPWKRPQDLLRAFAQANISNAWLAIAGEGPLRASLEEEAKSLGISARVRFLGFVNQTALPEVYRSADLFVLPSDYEPFGVVVNEAMLCGCPVIVSDRVGARFDLVREGQTGFVFPVGEISSLARILRDVLPDRHRLQVISKAATQRMASWSPRDNIEASVEAIEQAVRLRSSSQGGTYR
jgi:glycosyltransferase involved in cell wall biosynthesis